jgi:hypothetical protein
MLSRAMAMSGALFFVFDYVSVVGRPRVSFIAAKQNKRNN